MAASDAVKDVEAGEGDVLGAAGVNLPPEPELKGPLKPISETNVAEKVAGGVAAAAVGTSIAAIIATGSTVVLLAGVLSSTMGPYVYYQQTKLTDIAALKETSEAVQREVNRLAAENDRLSKNIKELGETVDQLKDVEGALDAITKTQGQSVEAFEQQVEESEQILKKMQKSTRGRIIQNLISVIYRGDDDGDNMISSDEADEVIEGLGQIGGLKVNEERLREAIVGKSIESIIEVVKNLMNDDLPDGERIFEIED